MAGNYAWHDTNIDPRTKLALSHYSVQLIPLLLLGQESLPPNPPKVLRYQLTIQ